MGSPWAPGTVMPLATGARFGRYEILSLVGVGGMGEVYKGLDRRLDRIVAIKLLPADPGGRADRRTRLEREARAISSLSHPNICTLFDVGEENGSSFLVMEYLDGETLHDRLTRGALSTSEISRYAVQIADALGHAHSAHVIHRDLKPSNVMLTAPSAKLLDFGLARRELVEPLGPATSTISLDSGPLSSERTVGTLQYMAPEQLEGAEVDARTDIFAFGTLLFEMATGRKAFVAASQASLTAAILTEQPPPISSMRASDVLPPALDHVVERCLAKNPDDRWQTVRDLRLELDWALTAGVRPPRKRRRRTIAAVEVLLAALAVAAISEIGPRRPAPSRSETTRFVIAPPAGSVIPYGEQRTRIAISPDGRQLAFVAVNEGHLQLFVRALASLESHPLAGTEGAVSPFWSPDSRSVGFFVPSTGELKKIDPTGGSAQTLCTAEIEGLPEWGDDNTVLFSVFRDGIHRVSGDGGIPVRVTSLDKNRPELNHYWPSFLPDGKHFIFLATARTSETTKAVPSVYVAALDGSDRKLLDRIHSRVIYVNPGYLLFEEEGNLMVRGFELSGLQMTGSASRIADGVSVFRTLGTAHFTASRTGTLAYLGSGDVYDVVWFDRQGNATPTGWAKQEVGGLRISPDSQNAIADVYDARTGTADLWVYDLLRNVPRRFTTEAVSERSAVWSPDGRRILFTTEQGGSPNLFTKTLDGGGELQAMVRYPAPIFAEDWSPDSRLVAYSVNTVKTGSDLWLKPLDGNREARPFLNTRFEELAARFSPDSQWLAFVSNETSSSPEVYVAPIAQPGARRQISIGGGTAPRWRRDGKELFYVGVDNRSMMAVAINSLAPLRAAAPVRLFTIPTDTAATRDRVRSTMYDVTSDGQRFLVSLPSGEPRSSRITVVLNWQGSLAR